MRFDHLTQLVNSYQSDRTLKDAVIVGLLDVAKIALRKKLRLKEATDYFDELIGMISLKICEAVERESFKDVVNPVSWVFELATNAYSDSKHLCPIMSLSTVYRKLARKEKIPKRKPIVEKRFAYEAPQPLDAYDAIDNVINNDTERTIVSMIMDGYSQNEIADKLNISQGMVSKIFSQIRSRGHNNE